MSRKPQIPPLNLPNTAPVVDQPFSQQQKLEVLSEHLEEIKKLFEAGRKIIDTCKLTQYNSKHLAKMEDILASCAVEIIRARNETVISDETLGNIEQLYKQASRIYREISFQDPVDREPLPIQSSPMLTAVDRSPKKMTELHNWDGTFIEYLRIFDTGTYFLSKEEIIKRKRLRDLWEKFSILENIKYTVNAVQFFVVDDEKLEYYRKRIGIYATLINDPQNQPEASAHYWHALNEELNAAISRYNSEARQLSLPRGPALFTPSPATAGGSNSNTPRQLSATPPPQSHVDPIADFSCGPAV